MCRLRETTQAISGLEEPSSECPDLRLFQRSCGTNEEKRELARKAAGERPHQTALGKIPGGQGAERKGDALSCDCHFQAEKRSVKARTAARIDQPGTRCIQPSLPTRQSREFRWDLVM